MKQEEVILGARVLGEQIINVMPTYYIMLNQIKDIRKTAQQIGSRNSIKVEDEKKQVFNNTIGIFGPRGAGKSSALYTLRNELKRKSNVLLPLIEPDNFGENTKIIGSIIGFLKDEGEELVGRLKKTHCSEEKMKQLDSYFNAGVFKPNNNLQRLLNEIVEYHLYTESQYRNILTQHFEDFAVHIKNSSQLLSPDISFMGKLYELINEIIFVKTVLDEPKEAVLLFVFIDDIDLNTSKIRELMETLLKFTDHPNLVTVLSGDYEILVESLTMALLADDSIQKIGLTPYDSLKSLDQPVNNSVEDKKKLTIISRKSGLAHEYLKKTIPSARRHQLVQWNLNTIPYFSFGKFNLLERLAQLMGGKSIFSYEKLNKSNNEFSESIYFPIKNSYVIFDYRPRGLVFAYYNLVQLLSEIQTNENDTFKVVKSFVDTLVLSNTQMLQYQEWFLERCIRWGSSANSTYIDYENGHILNKLRDDNRGLQFFILAEVIKKLLPGVQYNGNSFQSYKKNLFEKYIATKKARSSKPNPYGNRLYHIVRGLIFNTEIPIAMLLIEFISNSSFDSYYYDSIWDNNAREKDLFIVDQLNKLVEQFPSLFENLYYKAQNEMNQEVNFALNLIHEICSMPSKFEVTEKVYKNLLEKFNFNPNEEASMDVWFVRTLFINNLTEIREGTPQEFSRVHSSNEQGGSLTVRAADKNQSLAKGLEYFIRKYSENAGDEIPDSVTMAINNRMEIFSEYIADKVTDQISELYIEISHNTISAYKNFMAGNSGVSSTRYAECKDFVNRINMNEFLSFEMYKKLIDSLNQLASNNRVWYGRREARDFYNSLQYTSKIANFLKGNDTLVLRLYYRYYFITTKLSKDHTNDHKKNGLKMKLDEAFNKIMNQTEFEIGEFSFNLEESEAQVLYDGEIR